MYNMLENYANEYIWKYVWHTHPYQWSEGRHSQVYHSQYLWTVCVIRKLWTGLNILISIASAHFISAKAKTKLSGHCAITLPLLTQSFMKIFVSPHYFCINLNTGVLKRRTLNLNFLQVLNNYLKWKLKMFRLH